MRSTPTPENARSRAEFNASLIGRLESIREELGLQDTELHESLGVTRPEFSRIATGKKALTASQIDSFCETVGCDPDNLLAGELDFKALASHYHGDHLALPEKYSLAEHKLARVRAIKSVYDYLERCFGADYAKRVLRRLQLHPALLHDPTRMLSPQALLDMLEELEARGFTDGQFRRSGTMYVKINSGSEIGRALADAATPKKVYQVVHENLIHHFDRLFHYRLTALREDGCTMEITPQESAQDLFHEKTIGHKPTCLFKQGIYMSFIGHIRNYFARISETECMYEGGSKCVYHLSWA